MNERKRHICPVEDECRQIALTETAGLPKLKRLFQGDAPCRVPDMTAVLRCVSYQGIQKRREKAEPSWARVITLPRERDLLEEKLAQLADLIRRVMTEDSESMAIVLLPERNE
jgi:hypothetical protein